MNKEYIKMVIYKSQYQSPYSIIKKLNGDVKPGAKKYSELYNMYYYTIKSMEVAILENTGLSDINKLLWTVLDMEPKDEDGRPLNMDRSVLRGDVYPIGLAVNIYNSVYGGTTGKVNLDYDKLFASYTSNIDKYLEDCRQMEIELRPMIMLELNKAITDIEKLDDLRTKRFEQGPLFAILVPYFMFVYDPENLYANRGYKYDKLGDIYGDSNVHMMGMISAYFYCKENNLPIFESFLLPVLEFKELVSKYAEISASMDVETFARKYLEAYYYSVRNKNSFSERLNYLVNKDKIEISSEIILSTDKREKIQKIADRIKQGIPSFVLEAADKNVAVALLMCAKDFPEAFEAFKDFIE